MIQKRIDTRCSLCGMHAKHTLTLQHQSLAFDMCKHCLKDMPFRKAASKRIDLALAQSQSNVTVLAACHYRYPVDELIIAYKYRGDLRLSGAMVDLYKTLPKPPTNTLLVPMPSAKSRLNERGFDHILILAKKLGSHWQLPIWQGVKRSGSTANQKGLSRRERLHNMLGQFTLTQPVPLGCKLLLIDDVCTTGASLSALAQCLSSDFLSGDSQQRPAMRAYVLAH